MGGLHIVVSNAGVTRDMLMMMMKPEMWDEVIRLNLTAYFRLAKASLRTLTKQRYGRIIGVTSIVGVTGNAGQANYAASKAGMIGMTKSLAAEIATRNVTVNCIAPGFIATAMTDALNDQQKAAILSKIPAGQMGKPEDIAAAAVFLASEEAGYVTGQTQHVNGGMAMI
jgi:3-oxoacyl-[acyl-carrier protein] reductase